jgi:hypothetical protein
MTQGAPTWKDHLGTIPVGKAALPYAGGTKTMDWQNMEAANQRHASSLASQEGMFAQEMALKRQQLALDQWEAQQRWAINWLEHEALKAASAQVGSGGLTDPALIEQGLRTNPYSGSPYTGVLELDMHGRGGGTNPLPAGVQQPAAWKYPQTQQQQKETLYGTQKEKSYFR